MPMAPGGVRAGAVVAALAALGALVPTVARGAVDRTVDSGALRAAVSPNPWHLAFTDRDGRQVLAEAGGTGLSPTGTLGFSSAGVWWHATRVLRERRHGGSYEAMLATTDPAGRTVAVRVAPDADGVIKLTATVSGSADATGIAFGADRTERFLGFGERSNAVDQRGGTVEDYVAEGPYQPIERPFIAAFVPLPGYHPRDDATYFPIPWLLSTRGYGVLVDNDETSRFRLGSDSPDAWSAEVDGSSLSLRVFAGPTPAAALARFSARIGRQPPAAAPWYFGPWFQPKGEDGANLATLRRAGAPASVAQTYTHYLPCGDQVGTTERQRARTALFHAAGLAVTTYFNPMICTSYEPTYDEAAAQGALTRNALGQPYVYRYTGASQFLVSQFDFSSPAAVAFYGRLLGEAVADGYDGWMEDFGEYTPTDAVSANGMSGAQMHNAYPAFYHGAARAFSRAAPRPLARFNRSGWTGAAAVSQIVWGGDPTTGWGFDGLASAVRNGLTMGLSGVSLWGSDIGGYFALSEPQTTPDLERRWIEVGFASGVMRTEADGFSLTGSPRAQIFDPDVLGVWTRYARLRTQLYPYLAAAERTYDRTGMPLMRQLALRWPDDPRATARDDEYLLGPDLLVAPVLAPGATTRRLYLPAGHWVDLWRSIALGADGAPILGAARLEDGGRDLTAPAPPDELPLLVPAGAVIPLLSPDVQTLTSYGTNVVRLADRQGELRLLAWPHGTTRGALGPGERWESHEGRGRWSLRVSGRRTRVYRLQASLATLRRPLVPCRVTASGRTLSRRAWSFDRTTGVLRARFRVRAGTVTARVTCAEGPAQRASR